jgi:hypothetical protein
VKTVIYALVTVLVAFTSIASAEEESSVAKIGPDKGIIEAKEGFGMKLSPEAEKNFEIKTLKLTGAGPWLVPHSARVTAGEESSLYRVRDGFYKRISLEIVQKTESELRIRSESLKSGDGVVIQGTGFLRISELAAFGESAEEKRN